jgi:hypothetical protein
MTPALSITEKAIEQSSACGHGLVGGRETAIDERPRSEPVRGGPPASVGPDGTGRAGRSWPGKPSPDGRDAPAPRLVAHVEVQPHERAPKVDVLSRRRSKLARGAWSWLHARLLLGGSGYGPWDYRFVEDDYRRLAKRPQEIGVFWQR